MTFTSFPKSQAYANKVRTDGNYCDATVIQHLLCVVIMSVSVGAFEMVVSLLLLQSEVLCWKGIGNTTKPCVRIRTKSSLVLRLPRRSSEARDGTGKRPVQLSAPGAAGNGPASSVAVESAEPSGNDVVQAGRDALVSNRQSNTAQRAVRQVYLLSGPFGRLDQI